LSSVLWCLGRYEDAADTLAQLKEMVGKPESLNKELMSHAYLIEAYIALSQGRLSEVSEKVEQARALAPPASGRNDLAVETNDVLCLAASYGGAHARGRTLCEDAAQMAESIKDPTLVSDSQLALAEALVEAGDAEGARAVALRAEEFFARSERVESDWRALVVAGKASRRAGDEAAAKEYFARAAALITQLEKSWGADASGYFLRPDVQRLRRELDDDAVAEVR
jgi:tetratricopeptide (TPR) repeat protein